MNKLINYKHLERLLTSQPYFVWNQDLKKVIEKQVNIDDVENNLEYEDLSAQFWELDFDFDLEDINQEYEYISILKNGFSFVKTKFYEFIETQAKIENSKIGYVNEKKQELAIEQTQKLLNDSNIDWIVNPVFIYKNTIIKPSIYKKNQKTISSLFHSTKTKLINYIRAYFEICVMEKLGIQVSNYTCYIYDKKWVYHKPKDLRFEEQEYIWTSKGGPNSKTKSTVEKNNENLKIIDKINLGYIKKDRNSRTPLHIYKSDFDFYIEKIEEAKKTKAFHKPNWKDLTLWGTNPLFLDIFPFEEINAPRVSGNLLSKEDLINLLENSKTLGNLATKKRSLKLFLSNEDKFDWERIHEQIQKLDDCVNVWYDFEGFSMPYVVLPFTKPYQQIIFQVSVIKTRNNKIFESQNIVIDPQKITVNDFMKIIDAIYCEEAKNYIVYNKSYENSRLDEMLNAILLSNLDSNLVYKNKVQEITSKEKTFDLNDLFKISNSKIYIPPIFMHELKGYSSIKKIENYITTNKLNLELMITPYKNLEVQNGLMAMNNAIQRYLGTIGDIEWQEIAKHLAKYCENDVKAMIMVYYFVLHLIKTRKNQ